MRSFFSPEGSFISLLVIDNPMVSNALDAASILCSVARQSLSLRLFFIPSRAASCKPLSIVVYSFSHKYQLLLFVTLSLELAAVLPSHWYHADIFHQETWTIGIMQYVSLNLDTTYRAPRLMGKERA